MSRIAWVTYSLAYEACGGLNIKLLLFIVVFKLFITVKYTTTTDNNC